MSDPLKPIDRPSLASTDQKKYEAGGTFALGAASKAGKGTYSPKGDLASRYTSGSGFGMGAKTAGKTGLAKTDAVDVGNKIQKEFQPFAQRGVSSFQPGALDYSARQYKISTQKYKG
jgi:hypothetical protein